MKTQVLPWILKTRASVAIVCRGALFAAVCVGLSAYERVAFAATANPPDVMTYQGFLVDANGVPLAQSNPQNYPIAFRIYSGQSGGTPLWAEQQIVTVDKGSFSVMLGEGTPVGADPRPALSSVFAGANASDRYISAWVTIGGNTMEILPRLRLAPSPYSFLSTSAANLIQPNGFSFVNFSGGQINLAGGNVGIGTSAAGRRLQIGDINSIGSEGMIRLASRSGAGGGALRTWDIGVPQTGDNVIGAGYSFVIDDISTTGPEFMVQFNSGNVGIGTTNPVSRLDVNGNISLGNTHWIQARNNAGIMEPVFWPRWNDNVTYLNYGDGGFHIRNNDSTTVMFMRDNGYVGIGTTAPQAPLSFGSTLGNTKLALWENGLNTGYGFGIQQNQFRFHVNTAADDFLFLNTPGSGEVMRIKGNGNVGIGTASPGNTLQIGSTFHGAAGYGLSVNSAQYGANIQVNRGPGAIGNALIIDNSANGDANASLLFVRNNVATAAQTILNVRADGNMGVGTFSPAAKLDVRGDIKLGSSGQFSAAAGDENLRIIRGKVRIVAGPTPQAISGSGFTVTRSTTYPNVVGGTLPAAYRISFTTAFADAPAVTVTPTHDASSTAAAALHYNAKVEFTGPTEAVVSFYNVGGNAVVDSPFSFVAVGAR
jgi:hypothetical protein